MNRVIAYLVHAQMHIVLQLSPLLHGQMILMQRSSTWVSNYVGYVAYLYYTLQHIPLLTILLIMHITIIARSHYSTTRSV